MPTRPRSHSLEDESRRAFASLLPAEWVIRPLVSDYGIDDQVEVFNKSGNASGLMFLAQLKATDKRDLRSALKLSFKVDTLSYYRSLELPVMIVRFHAPTKRFYWRWFHEFPERPKPKQKVLSLRIPDSAKWDDRTPDEVTGSLQMFRLLKSPSWPQPLVFNLSLPDDSVGGVPSSLLRAAIRNAGQTLTGILRFSEEGPVGAHPKVTISREELTVDLAGLKTFIWRFEEPFEGPRVTTKLPHDVLTAVAFVLAKADHFNEASEIASSHLDQSNLIKSANVFFELLRAMARSRRVSDALRLARQLLRSAAGPRLAQWLLVLAMARTGSLQDSELEYLRAVMRMIIERATELGDARLLAIAHYNLGNHLRSQYPRSAFNQYRLAAKSQPGYRQRPYFWKELAGILHVLRHFEWAAAAYQKAVQIGGGTMCLALRADSLMFTGRFREALKLMDKYMALESKPDAEWRLKQLMLSRLVDKLGIAEQKRRLETANKLAGTIASSEQEMLIPLLEAIRTDALSSVAWFNLGAVLGQKGLPQESFEAYLFAGICSPNDTEAWTRALMSGVKVFRENSISALLTIWVAQMAYRNNGQRFLDELRQCTDRQDAGFPTVALIDLVTEAVKDIDRMNRLTEVRAVGEGAKYELVLGI